VLSERTNLYATKTEHTDTAYLLFNEESVARGVLQAFTHAAELCRSM